MRQKAFDVIYSAIDGLNEQLSADRRLTKTPGTAILGSGGTIDSVSFINLVVLLEEKCQESFGTPVTLTTDDTNAMDDNNPFRNVESLADHICQLVQKQPQ